MSRFIYVFSKNDRDTLSANGYNLLKSNDTDEIYVFENKAELKFEFSDMERVYSDVMTF